ncbi:dihydroorotate dehydrogenase (fumarate) [Cryptococcus wingfieldii CBS 7118]|uniref:Dihydroorotate dehydrogenase (quinone), mitochondrial n=1 Tax=Cryptococcus wingfieldii CBS 7118 TaxID=1295528 RepID=A0A1E3K2T0_9TREE|nr:dihydroorotate dehydrogenase (fumarate) [Cryptococcus wingfieldii CBS 7118]ODO07321.1 dihydroorotate dehydrogenase (fumarate) [Cryptococcus wingfieldii CBS 7118]
MSYRLPIAPLRRRIAPSSLITVSKRFASTSAPRPGRRYLSTTLLLGGGVLGLAYYYDSRSLLHEHVVMPITRLVADPEEGHKLAVRVLSWDKWARPRDMGVDGPELQAELFGHKLTNPLGIAAGFDKDASAIDGLFDLGFGYVEVGSITPEPQPGNPTPRFFRLEEDDAAINRYGFNSLGHGQALNRLRERVVRFSREHPSLFPAPLPANPLPPAGLPRSLRPGQLLAVNLGKNKTSAADSNEDYIRGVRTFGPYADVLIINVSSPNTPGLRALQGRKQLESLLGDVVKERNRLGGDGLPKIAVKVTADLGEEELADVAGAVRSSGVEGVIVSNTTIRRQELNLKSANQHQIGGLSGKPLFPYALQSLRTLRPLLPPSIPLIGCGGVSTGSDAVEMANAGASLVQVYTSFGYRGVGTPRLIKDEITESLKSQGGASWSEQVGKDWMGKEGGVAAMGWDENRIKHEAELLKTEAASLASLLKEAGEKQDLGRLVAEAEKALGLRKGEEQQLVKEGKATEEQQQVGAGQAQKQVAQSSIGEALISDPVGKVDLGPIVVLDEQKVKESALIEEKREREAEWSREAKQGAKRLV